MTELEPRAGEELERQLERFARVRLDPSPLSETRLAARSWRPPGGSARCTGPLERGTVRRGGDDGPPLSVPRRRSVAWPVRRLELAPAGRLVRRRHAHRPAARHSAFASSRAGGPLYDTPRPRAPDAALRHAGPARGGARPRPGPDRGDRRGQHPERPRRGRGRRQGYLASLDDLDESVGGPADRRWSRSRPIARCSWRCAATCRPRHRQHRERPRAEQQGHRPPRRRRDAAAGPRAVPAHRVATAGPPARNGGAGSNTGGGIEERRHRERRRRHERWRRRREADPTPKVTRTPKPAPTPERPSRTPSVPDKGPQGGKP